MLGALALYGLFDKVRSKKNGEVENANEKLIGLLQDTVNELEKRFTELSGEYRKLSGDFEDLMGKHKIVVEILQGRDKQTQEFYVKAYEVMEIAKSTNTMVKTLAESQNVLFRIIEAHFKTSTSHGPTGATSLPPIINTKIPTGQ